MLSRSSDPSSAVVALASSRPGQPRRGALLLAALLGLAGGPAGAQAQLPPADTRADEVKTLNTPRAFPEVESAAAWQARARQIHEQILVSCGLWPIPVRPPLKPVVAGRVEREGYSIERVWFQTYPGFFLAGNLYRPLGRGSGPFPGVLNPHGHWQHGRLEDTEEGSLPARCIQFARLGMVAFAYDMVGYNDTRQVTHQFASDPTNLLWNVSLMGLQLWNSVRALDFLAGLPDVDSRRLACTGASGGGTQTFMLGAVDDRLAAQAPVVMVSHSMQGGCLCENAPGLRVEYSNMEFAAAAAPRPQILVAASGDWTRTTPTVEGPAVARIYELLEAVDRFRFVRFDFGHNYNQTSREAVYGWFGRWLLNETNQARLLETPHRHEPDAVMRVFPDDRPPPGALDEAGVIRMLIDLHRAELQALTPRDPASLARFREIMGPAWRHTLQLAPEIRPVRAPGRRPPPPRLNIKATAGRRADAWAAFPFTFGRSGAGDRIASTLFLPEAKTRARYSIVLVHPRGQAEWVSDQGEPVGLARELVEAGEAVLVPDLFQTGAPPGVPALEARSPFKEFFTVYNRTDLQERVQDLVTTCSFLRTHGQGRPVVLWGVGEAGTWTLLAAPAADGVVADAAGWDWDAAETWMRPERFVPGILNLGGPLGVAALAAPHPLLVHRLAPDEEPALLQAAYEAAGAGEALRRESGPVPALDSLRWLRAHPVRSIR